MEILLVVLIPVVSTIVLVRIIHVSLVIVMIAMEINIFQSLYILTSKSLVLLIIINKVVIVWVRLVITLSCVRVLRIVLLILIDV